MSFVRPSWDEYFLEIASLTSKRSNCIKRKVGCVIVKNNRIISLGYNGTPAGFKNCFDGGCKRCFEQHQAKQNGSSESFKGEKLDLCICLHAEENAIIFSNFLELKDATLYVSLCPCVSCFKKIIQCGISKVIYIEDYNFEMTQLVKTLAEETSIRLEKVT